MQYVIKMDIEHQIFDKVFLPDLFIEDTIVWGRDDFAQQPIVNDIMQVEVDLHSGKYLYQTSYNLAFNIFLWKVFPEWFLWNFLACLASRLARYWVEQISANSSSSGVNIAGQQFKREKGSSKKNDKNCSDQKFCHSPMREALLFGRMADHPPFKPSLTSHLKTASELTSHLANLQSDLF